MHHVYVCYFMKFFSFISVCIMMYNVFLNVNQNQGCLRHTALFPI